MIVMMLPGNVNGQENAVHEEPDAVIERKCHNFADETWSQVTQTCRVCHVLHSEKEAMKRYVDGLFWSRNIGSIAYNMYHSSWGASLARVRDVSFTSRTTGRQGNLPDGISKLCLSCHDGLIAPDVFTLHHFVSVEYDPAKTSLREPEETALGFSGTIADVLDGGVVQCSSCHDVHGEEAIEDTRLLRAEPSKICTICHRMKVDRVKADG